MKITLTIMSQNTYVPKKPTRDDEHKTIIHKKGDLCRIKTSLLSSELRKINKSGYQKYVPIRWSVTVYKVLQVFINKKRSTR